MLSERLRSVLGERRISIAEFSEMCNLPVETVKNVYYGKTTDPKISTVMQMSEALKISVNCLMGKCPHTKEERAIIQNYRACGHHGKSLIELVARYEANAAKSEREAKDRHMVPCLIPHGDIRSGIVYDNCEVIEIETASKEAYVGIRMINNDLVPAYCKDDVILIEDRFPRSGEYAAFFKDNRAYIRKYIEEDGKYRLKCLHKMGEDIILKRMDQIEYIGTCIDVIRA